MKLIATSVMLDKGDRLEASLTGAAGLPECRITLRGIMPFINIYLTPEQLDHLLLTCVAVGQEIIEARSGRTKSLDPDSPTFPDRPDADADIEFDTLIESTERS